MEPGLSRSAYFGFMKKMMIFWWLMAPFAMFAPAWNSVHARPDEHGLWVGYAVLGAPVFAMWVYMFKLGRMLWRVMDLWEAEDIAAAQERALKERLTVVRAERLQRAEARLARLHQANEETEAAELAADLVELRDELDD